MDLSVDDMCEIWSIVDNIRGLRGGVNVKGACHGERGKCECRVDIQDSVEGDVVCSECGIIKQERVLLAQDHFDSNDNRIMQESSKDEFFENKQLSTRISKNWRCKRPASALMHKLQLHGSINQQQIYRYREFADIERICELLQTALTVANSSKHYFNNLCKIKTFRGANRLAMKGCAIMRSLKDNKVSRDVSEMLKACNVTKKVLTRNFVGANLLLLGSVVGVFRVFAGASSLLLGSACRLGSAVGVFRVFAGASSLLLGSACRIGSVVGAPGAFGRASSLLLGSACPLGSVIGTLSSLLACILGPRIVIVDVFGVYRAFAGASSLLRGFPGIQNGSINLPGSIDLLLDNCLFGFRV